MNTDTPCTQADRDKIIKAAQERARYLRWLAMYLPTRDKKIIDSAAKVLRQLAGGAQEVA